MEKGKRQSPYLQKCCLLLSANESYARAEEDIATLTGIKISHSTQQRLVHRTNWEEPKLEKPNEEMSLDGGMIRVRTEKGKPCEWKEYKGLNIHGQAKVAYFKDNESLCSWVNSQPLAEKVVCLGDGHDGVWSIFAQIGVSEQREEILDWYHLMENAHKITASKRDLEIIESFLWRGKTREVKKYIKKQKIINSVDFINYLNHHQHRIIDYQTRQENGGAIGSGAVESLVKQIASRVKLSGAQWAFENVPKVLKHRCAYLNGVLG